MDDLAIYSINALPNSLYLGKQTETGVREIRIDCAPWFALWPNLSISVWVTPPGSAAAYPAAVQLEGEVLTWPITSADTATAGGGYVEIMGTAEGQKKLSATVPTLIQATTTGATTTPPDSARPWVDQVLEAAERAEAAAERAESAGGSGGSAGGIVAETDPTVYDWAKQPQKPTYTADEVNAIGKDALPQAIEAALAQAKESGEFDGAPGPKGDPGADGCYYQPSVTDGVLSWTPSNGDMPSVPASDVRGPAGQDGQPGAPGKTAYQYAQDGGYTGTEAEFAEKLAQEIPEPYTLPVATAERLGGMMVGDGLMADEDGRVSVKPEGKYELITTLNNEKEVSNIWITQGKDGNPLRLKRAIVKVLVPVSDVEFYLGVYVTFTSGQAMRAVGLCDAKNATMGYRVECYPRNGFYTLRGYYPYRGYSNVYMSLAEANAESCAFSDEYAIKQITINIAGGNVNGVPVGTTIELQGVLE